MKLSNRIYVFLVAILAALAALNLYLPQGDFVATLPVEDLPAPRPIMALAVIGIMVILYGGLGWLGRLLARRLDFPDLWDRTVSQWQRFGLPAVTGIAAGLFFIVADLLFSRYGTWGALPHPPFPTSLVASITAGIGEELIFRLFFIPFWLWLLSSILLRGRWQTTLFWVVAILSALAFALGHVPAVMLLLNIQEFAAVPPLLLTEILLLNGLLSLLAAHYLRHYGFLAAVGVHFWADIIWHVLWGYVQ